MVGSIRFWMKAFNILSLDDQLTEFAHKLLADDGYDPYLEDEGTLWLLHYQLIKKDLHQPTPLYSMNSGGRKLNLQMTISLLTSNANLKQKNLFSSTQNFARRFSVLTKMYLRSDAQSKDKEDSFSGLLTELDLIKTFSKGKQDYFIIENTERTEIPDEIILYAILDNEIFEASVNLNSIEMNANSVGTVFAINRTGLMSKIETLTQKYNYIVFNDQAGIKELQFKRNHQHCQSLENIMTTKFTTSTNIIRDSGRELNYIPTPNSIRVVNQIVNDFKKGIRSFNIIGSYGTGKSSFLWALQQSLQGKKRFSISTYYKVEN